jgi:hypothetical protein
MFLRRVHLDLRTGLRRPPVHFLKEVLGWRRGMLGMMRTWRYRRLGLLHQQVYAAILGCAHQEVTLPVSAQPQKRKDVAVAIPDMDPVRVLGRRAEGLDTALPDLRFPLALLALLLGLFGWGWLAKKGLLMGQAQHA